MAPIETKDNNMIYSMSVWISFRLAKVQPYHGQFQGTWKIISALLLKIGTEVLQPVNEINDVMLVFRESRQWVNSVVEEWLKYEVKLTFQTRE
jgi:hypothetical protein